MPSLFVTTLVSCALAAGSMVAAQPPAPAVKPTPVSDRQYFHDIAAHQFAVPAGASAFVLARQLTPWLASPDPTLRDDLAYTILDHAHTADLLAALARNPLFTPADQQALFIVVEQRLASAGRIYTYGEQDRLAVALLCIITRDDFQLAAYQSWLQSLQQDSAVWQKSPPDPVQLALFENHTYLLEALLARMPIQTPLSPAATQARDAARALLRKR